VLIRADEIIAPSQRVPVAEQYRDIGTNDFLTGLMERHEKMAWMLRAHLEERPA